VGAKRRQPRVGASYQRPGNAQPNIIAERYKAALGIELVLQMAEAKPEDPEVSRRSENAVKVRYLPLWITYLLLQ